MRVAAARRDEVELVLLAARAGALDPHEVLARADVAALARCTAAVESATAGVEAAAAALVAILTERPFAQANRATAALACAFLAADETGLGPLTDDVLHDLVFAVEAGAVGYDDVVAALRHADRRRRGVPWPCPTCGRRLHVVGLGPRVNWVSGQPAELRALCAREHGVHDRSGRAPAVVAPPAGGGDRWTPIVREPSGRSILVLADGGALLLVPADADRFEAVGVGELPIGALVGPWSRLAAGGTSIGRVAAWAVVTDASGSSVDWPALLAALAADRVPA